MQNRLGELRVGYDGGTDTGEGVDPEIGERSRSDDEKNLDSFFVEVNSIKRDLANVEQGTKDIEKTHVETLKNVIAEKHKELTGKVEELIDNTGDAVQSVKSKLKGMQESNSEFEKKNGVSTVSRIRENQHRMLSKEFMGVIKGFQDVQKHYHQELREKIKGEMRIVNPDATEEQIERAVEDGGAQVFGEALLGARRDELLVTFTEIQEKNRDILKIEESLYELQSMFVDLATLVDMQATVLDNIEKNVSKSEQYIEKGLDEVGKAREYQRKARRKKVFLMVIGLAVLLVVIVPVTMTG